MGVQFPSAISALTQLEELNLQGLYFKGFEMKNNFDCYYLPSLEKTIPNYIYNMTNLRNLELNSFSMIGEIPVQLTTLSKLENLQLGSNYFSGSCLSLLI